jgi:proline dehydrogenase
MMRSILIYLSKASWAQKMVTGWSFAWRMASRFVAGELMDDAVRAVRELNARGINATLDQLGEHTSTAAEADQATDKIIRMLDQIQESGICANLSIKLTQLGMGLDNEVCKRNLSRILDAAKRHGNFVRIDMEDSPYTDTTLSLLGEMRALGYGPETVGTVLQSYLYRSEDDLRRLVESGTKIRLVKGAYNEPPRAAFSKKADVDANYDHLTTLLLEAASSQHATAGGDGCNPPFAALGTHDPRRIDFGKAEAVKANLPKSALEIQMLYGIRRDLQDALSREGYPVRVYVPFGTHWYPYFMRRLAERPANIWFFISNLFRG